MEKFDKALDSSAKWADAHQRAAFGVLIGTHLLVAWLF